MQENYTRVSTNVFLILFYILLHTRTLPNRGVVIPILLSAFPSFPLVSFHLLRYFSFLVLLFYFNLLPMLTLFSGIISFTLASWVIFFVFLHCNFCSTHKTSSLTVIIYANTRQHCMVIICINVVVFLRVTFHICFSVT